MKFIRIAPLLFLLMKPTHAFSQKYEIAGPPVSGYFYFDSAEMERRRLYNSVRCIDIVSSGSTVLASGKGRVMFCNIHADKTYEVAVRYANTIVVYTKIAKKNILKSQLIGPNYPIGELNLDVRDKKYHLGLQVWDVGTPNTLVWDKKLVRYLNGTLVNN